MKKIACIIALVCAVTVNAGAQDLKSILSGVAKAVVGDKATTATSIVGTWKYVGPACEFESDNLLANAGGEVASAKVEEKLEGVLNKVGINTIQYTFNEDGTCSYSIKNRTTSGTYTFDAEAKTITIKTGKLGISTTASVVTLGSNMSFVYDADKLMSALKTITSAASKVNSTASTLSSLASSFDGMKLGFELEKQ
ncbi:MAG: DUF4923 family protein [Bacteroides sp.]|nr:DUF4923 family protein [Bacteroides sp.]